MEIRLVRLAGGARRFIVTEKRTGAVKLVDVPAGQKPDQAKLTEAIEAVKGSKPVLLAP